LEKKKEKLNPNEIATVENAKKCFDNAVRLYKDSKKVSLPSGQALLEIAIEELAKGTILLTNAKPQGKSEILRNVLGEKNLNKLKESEKEDFIEDIKIMFSPDINMNNHRDKLKVIQDVTNQVWVSYGSILPYVQDSTLKKNITTIFGNETIDMPHDPPNPFNDIDILALDKLKMSGLYVDYKEGKVIYPKDVNFDVADKLDKLFFFLYISLH
jgi:AbiV family abortive infection protein